MKRRVRLDRALAAPALARMAPAPKRQVREALRALADDPSGRSGRLDVKELDWSGEGPALLRVRVGEWRAVFSVDGREVFVLHIFHRSDGYGWLERLSRPARSGDE